MNFFTLLFCTLLFSDIFPVAADDDEGSNEEGLGDEADNKVGEETANEPEAGMEGDPTMETTGQNTQDSYQADPKPPSAGLGLGGDRLSTGTTPFMVSQQQMRCRTHQDCGIGNSLCILNYCTPAAPSGVLCTVDTECQQESAALTGCKGGVCFTASGSTSGSPWTPQGPGRLHCTNGGTPLVLTGSNSPVRCNPQGTVYSPYQPMQYSRCPYGSTCDVRLRVCCVHPQIECPWWLLQQHPSWNNQLGNTYPNNLQGQPFDQVPVSNNLAGNPEQPVQPNPLPAQSGACPPTEIDAGQTCVWSQDGSSKCPGGAYCHQNGACCILATKNS